MLGSGVALHGRSPASAPWARFVMRLVDHELAYVEFKTDWAEDESVRQSRRGFFDQMVAAMRRVTCGQVSFETIPQKRWVIRGAGVGCEILANFTALGFSFRPADIHRFFGDEGITQVMATQEGTGVQQRGMMVTQASQGASQGQWGYMSSVCTTMHMPLTQGAGAGSGLAPPMPSQDSAGWAVHATAGRRASSSVSHQPLKEPTDGAARSDGGVQQVTDLTQGAQSSTGAMEVARNSQALNRSHDSLGSSPRQVADCVGSQTGAAVHRLQSLQPAMLTDVASPMREDALLPGAVASTLATLIDVNSSQESPAPEPAAPQPPNAAADAALVPAAAGSGDGGGLEGTGVAAARAPLPASPLASQRSSQSDVAPTMIRRRLRRRNQRVASVVEATPPASSVPGRAESEVGDGATGHSGEAEEPSPECMMNMATAAEKRRMMVEPSSPKGGGGGHKVEDRGASHECSICMDAMVDSVFVPCGHMAACSGCAKKLHKKPCPVCRKKVKLVQRVYVA